VIVTLVLLVGVAPASAAPDKGSVVHVVRRGETLYSIARRYGVDMWSIARANGIANPNHIYAGQRLVIPSGRSGQTVHVVRRGETLLRIAAITNLNHIYVGQRLVIPGAAPPAPAPKPPPSPSVSYPGPWLGEYFDNVTLAAPVYTTRQDESINFNWAYGPPAGGMPTNSFSVRWTGTFNFGEGKYRFYAKVDDGTLRTAPCRAAITLSTWNTMTVSRSPAYTFGGNSWRGQRRHRHLSLLLLPPRRHLAQAGLFNSTTMKTWRVHRSPLVTIPGSGSNGALTALWLVCRAITFPLAGRRK
jgi:LysM repeat protein